MKRRNYILLSYGIGLSVCLSFVACRSAQTREAEKIVKEWVGKTIVFPDDVSCYSIDKERSGDCPSPAAEKYKVLLYTDSLGCLSCKLGLLEWQDVMEEADSLFPGRLDFLFYFQPKSKKELMVLLKREEFHCPVFIDTKNSIDALNQFPDNASYQCFLLDAENRVVLVGNPSRNSAIWELYKKQIAK